MDIRIPFLNAFKLRITGNITSGTHTEAADMNVVRNLIVNFVRRGRIFQAHGIDMQGRIVILNLGTLPSGTYGVELVGYYNGEPWRFFQKDVFEIVRQNSEATPAGSGDVPTYDVTFELNFGGESVSPEYLEAAIAAHDADEQAHPDLREEIANAGKVNDVQVDGQSILDPETKVANIDSSQFGKVDDVKVNGISVLDTETKEASFDITASVVENDSPGDPTATATMQDGNINIEFEHVKGEKGKDGATGPQGPMGNSAIFTTEGETTIVTLANKTGNSTAIGMTQKAVTNAMVQRGESVNGTEAFNTDNFSGCQITGSDELGYEIESASSNKQTIYISTRQFKKGDIVHVKGISSVDRLVKVGFVVTDPADIESAIGLQVIGVVTGDAGLEHDVCAIAPQDDVYAVYYRNTDDWDSFTVTATRLGGLGERLTDAETSIRDARKVPLLEITPDPSNYYAGRISSGNWQSRNSTAANPSDGDYANVVDYRGQTVEITANSESKAWISFVKNILPRSGAGTGFRTIVPGTQASSGTQALPASGTELDIQIPIGETKAFVIPEDCNYIYWRRNYGTNKATPAKIGIYKQGTLANIENDIKENEEKVLLSNARLNSGEQPAVSLLHFSDIHGDTTAMENISAYAERNGSSIDDIINTGDTVNAYYGDDAWTNIKKYGLDAALFAVGNHDRRTTNGYKTVPVADAYATFFENVDAWEVFQPEGAEENHLMYYYKDYAAGVRLIVLDGEAQDENQVEWLTNTLADARANDLTVVVAAHYVPGNFSEDYIVGTPWGKSTFHAAHNSRLEEINSTFKMGGEYPQAVQDYIDAGGKFAIWLCGHYHLDLFAYAWKGWGRNMSTDEEGNYYTDGNNKVYCGKSDILFSTINKAGMHNADSSADRSKVVHCANVVTIQPSLNVIKIIRVGINIDKWLRPINVLVYDYVQKKVISNY